MQVHVNFNGGEEVSESQIHEYAIRAIELLRTDGWCQHKMMDGRRSCLYGAIVRAVGSSTGPLFDNLYHRTLNLVEYAGLSTFNDSPHRTVDDVISILQRVSNGEGK